MTGQCEPKDIEHQPHVVRGRVFEEIARERVEEITGKKFHAKMVRHPEINFLGGTLDGVSEDGVVLEIKTSGKDVFEDLKNGGMIPHHHYLQLQHYMLCTGAEKGLYANYRSETDEIVIREIPKDEVIWNEIIEAAEHFWSCVKTKTEPDDYLMTDTARNLVKDWASLKSAVEVAEAQFKEVDEALKEELKSGSIREIEWSGFKAITVERVGAINYKSVQELKGVDLEKYRGRPTSYYKLSVAE
jgi:predicted phage-related endonuclease